MSMYCKYCGKVLTTGDRIDSCYPDCNPVKTSAERDQIKAENERLQARVQELEKQASPFLFAGNAILRAENERLREALNEIYDVPNISNVERAIECVHMMQDIAQQALNEVTK